MIVYAVNSATASAFDQRQANVYWLAVAVTVLVLFMSVVLARVLRIGAQDTQRTYSRPTDDIDSKLLQLALTHTNVSMFVVKDGLGVLSPLMCQCQTQRERDEPICS